MGEEAVDYLNPQHYSGDAASRFRRECKPSLRDFVIELESGAAASTVQNTAR